MSKTESLKPGATLTGLEKASVLLIALGPEVSGNILQGFTPDEIERITSEIVSLRKISPEIKEDVLKECKDTLNGNDLIAGEDYAMKVLEQVVGGAKAKELITRLTTGGGAGAFRWLRAVRPTQLAQCIKGERPQVVALIVGHLPPDIAAQVISSLPEQLQGEVALRLTTMQPTAPEVVKHVDDVLLQKLASSDNAALTEVGGNDMVVQILNNVDRSTEKQILEYLTETDPTVADAIKEKMFVFEDILTLDDRSIQIILREVPQEDLRLALKGTQDSTKEHFFRNMSQRAAETLKEDLESSGPVRLKDVESAQVRIANTARKLEEAGEISLRDSGEDLIQ